ncbi:hypothetical protein BJY52DRAFT_203042 [Lactarius psammicola]|nr:hypothetical protein BJY52DRAFT_203042 [Lactarius psammicola]
MLSLLYLPFIVLYYTMSQPHPSRSGDSYRCEPPASFPEPNVPGGYGAGRQVDMIDYSMYTPSQQPGYPQPLSPHPPPFPVLPTHPIDGHASVVPRCTGPIPPQPGTGYVNNNARPPPYTFPSAPHAQAPDPTRLPPYRFGNFATPGRPAVPEPEPHPVPSHSGGPSYSYIDEFVSSQGPYPQVRNPPVWPSPTPQPQPLYDVGLTSEVDSNMVNSIWLILMTFVDIQYSIFNSHTITSIAQLHSLYRDSLGF